MKRILSLLIVGYIFGGMANDRVHAEVEKTKIDYFDGDVALQGLLVRKNTEEVAKRPAVLVCHQWMGLTDYEEKRASMLAEMGYVVFALDIYGKGVRPTDRGAAAELAGKYKGDRALLRSRAAAGLKVLQESPSVDAEKIAVVGYCFGGTTALELARSGANIAAVVSFHGGLSTPDPELAKQIKAKILVLHGAADPHVPADEVLAFGKEMNAAGVDWQLFAYGGAVHGFSQWHAGSDPSSGVAYDKRADERSWQAMQVFFAEVL